MSLGIHIIFDGNCREAVTYYAKVFKQESPVFTTYGESDVSFDPNVQMSDKGKDLIMTTSLSINDIQIIFNDMPDNFEFIRGNSFGLTLSYEKYEDAKAVFEQLSVYGQVIVPITLLPNSNYHGMIVDQFQIMWTFSF